MERQRRNAEEPAAIERQQIQQRLEGLQRAQIEQEEEGKQAQLEADVANATGTIARDLAEGKLDLLTVTIFVIILAVAAVFLITALEDDSDF